MKVIRHFCLKMFYCHNKSGITHLHSAQGCSDQLVVEFVAFQTGFARVVSECPLVYMQCNINTPKGDSPVSSLDFLHFKFLSYKSW